MDKCKCVPWEVSGFQARIPNVDTFYLFWYYFHQDKRICSPKGRDCIEKNFAETFFCNTTCEGIYADVDHLSNEMEELAEEEPDQYLEEEFSGETEKLWKIVNDLKKKMTKDKIKTDFRVQEVQKEQCSTFQI